MNSRNDNFLKPRNTVSYLKIKDHYHPVYEGLNFIGRRKQAEVVIENANVSQYHAIITITVDKHFVSDIGSCNGTFLDKNKLQPQLLYEIKEGSIIHFGCVTAVYTMTSTSSQTVFVDHKTAENLSESFFTSSTQQLGVENVEQVFNNYCFDDDYDFNDVPTTQNVSTVVSVHDMPTQIFSSSELEARENCNLSKTRLTSIHDMSTPFTNHQGKACSIHEMPTQLFLNESNFENEISINTTSDIHDLPTQSTDFHTVSNLITAEKGIEMHELPTQINTAVEISAQKSQNEQIELITSNNDNEREIHKLPTQINSADEITTQRPQDEQIEVTSKNDKVKGIHELPTQINSADEISTQKPQDKQIELITSKNDKERGIHALPTQINSADEISTQRPHNEQIELITSKDDKERGIHELPTQINSAHEIATQKPQDKQIELIISNNDEAREIHELPTQINSADNISTQKPQDKQIESLCSIQNENEADPIERNQEQSNLVDSDKNEDVLCQPSTSKCLDNNAGAIIETKNNCVVGSPESECFVVDISDDIIDDSFVENVTVCGNKQEYLSLKSISKLTNAEPIPLQSSLQCSQPVGFSKNNKKSQPLVYSSSSGSEKCPSTDAEDVIIAGPTKNCLIINSDSDTDIEDLPAAASNSEIKNTKIDKLDYSGSDTDIENKVATTRKVVRRHKKCRKIDSDSDTDIENSNKEKCDSDSDTDIEDVPKTGTLSSNKISPKKTDKGFIVENSDSDTDIEIKETEVVCLGSKINTVREERDSDIIPCTQLSDDDVDDFNFGVQRNSTVVENNIMDDISENFSLRFSSNTQLSEDINNSKNSYVSVPSENHQNLRTESANNNKNELQIIEEIHLVAAKSTLEPALLLTTPNTLISDNLFSRTTQKINSDSNEIESLFIQPIHLFDQPTSPLVSDEKCNDDLFMEPTQKVVQTSKDEADDDLFMQLTQKVVQTTKNKTEDLFSCPTRPARRARLSSEDEFDPPTRPLVIDEKCDDDLFVQPTQKVFQTPRDAMEDLFGCPTQPAGKARLSSEDLFDQPTQPLVTDEKCGDDLFMQPTQEVFQTPKDGTENENLLSCTTQRAQNSRLSSENVFDEPTQPLVSDKKCDDDLFMQPTQKIVQTSKGEAEHLFICPTRPSEKSQLSSKDLFDLPTQPLVPNEDEIDDLFDQPTQKVGSTSNEQKRNENLFDQPTQPLFVEENLNVDLFLQPTQQITCPNDVTLKSKSPLKVLPDNSDKGSSVESQLEVMFASQSLLPQSNIRPSNPVVSILEGNYKTDSQDITSGNTPASEALELDVDQKEIIVKEKLSSKQNKGTTKKQTRSTEKNVIVDNKNNFASKEQNTSNKQLRSSRRPSVDDDKISERKSKRINSVKIDEQEVKVNKQNKKEKEGNSAESSKKTTSSKQSNEDAKEISKTSIENEKLEIRIKKPTTKKGGNASQETKMAVETKINTRKRTTRSDSVDSLNKDKAVKKTKPNDKSEIGDQTDIIKSSRRLRNLKKDPNKLDEIEETVVKKSSRTRNVEDIAGTSNEVVTIDLVTSPVGKAKRETKKNQVSTRSTRGSKKNSNSEQPLPEGHDIMTISSGDSDDDIILNKPRISKRKQEIQSPSTSSKRIKSSDTPPKSAPITKRNTRLLHKIDAVDEPVAQKRTDVSDTSDTNASNPSLQTPTRNQRLSNASSFSDTPNRNKRKQKPKVVFTMLDSPELESLIRSLGGTIVDTVNASTVLVTGSLKRSQKLLSAVGQGKPICSTKWLQECKKKSTFLDPWDYILEDKEAESKWNFSLKESLIRSQNKKLLENYFVLILTTTAVDVLKAAVESCGGKCVSRAPKDTNNFIVVASPENKGKYSKFVKQKVTIVSPEAIFDGVLRQELHFKDHLLS